MEHSFDITQVTQNHAIDFMINLGMTKQQAHQKIEQLTKEPISVSNHSLQSFKQAAKISYFIEDFNKLSILLKQLGDFYLENKQYILANIFYNIALAALKKVKLSKKTIYQKRHRIIQKIDQSMKEFILTLSTNIANEIYLSYQQCTSYKLQLDNFRKTISAKWKKKESNKDDAREEKIYKEIYEAYEQLMANITAAAEEILEKLGKQPPCAYAICFLGSLAQKLATFHSDVEFMVLYTPNDNKTPMDVSYFTALSNIICLMFINLGETPIPTSIIDFNLDKLARKGVSFDLGGKTPLGRINIPDKFFSSNPESVQQTVSIPASGQRINRDKLLSEDKVKKILRDRLPQEFQLGAAISKGDCFFDAMAQGLNQLSCKVVCDVKSLRLLCDAYAKNPQQHAWVKSALKSDDNYEQYLVRIQFTAQEMEENERQGILKLEDTVWGRPFIEGRMICEQFNVKLHVIEVLEEPVDGNYVMEQLIDANGTKSIELLPQTEYHDPRTVHIAAHKNHFVPLLSGKLANQLQTTRKLSQSFPFIKSDKQEVDEESRDSQDSKRHAMTQFNEHSPHSCQLINTPAEMAKLLRTKHFEDDKLLPIELMQCQYVYGNENLVQSYKDAIKIELKNTQQNGMSLREERALFLIKQDLIKYTFDLDEFTNEGKHFHLKNDFYRFLTTQISNLAIFFGFECQDIWQQLRDLQFLFNQEGYNDLKDALNLVTKLRLEHYDEKSMQDDDYKFEMGIVKGKITHSEIILKHLYELLIPLRDILKGFYLSNGKQPELFKDYQFEFFINVDPFIAKRLGNYQEAILRFDRAINELQEKAEEDDDNVDAYYLAGHIGFQGTCYLSAEQYDKALEAFQKSQAILNEATKKNHPDKVANLLHIATAEMRLERFDQTEKHLSEARIMQEELGMSDSNQNDITNILSNLGALYLHKRQFIKAEEYILQALGIARVNNDKFLISECLSNLGIIHFFNDDLKSAKDSFLEALQLTKDDFDENHRNMQSIYIGLSMVFHKLGNMHAYAAYNQKILEKFKQEHTTAFDIFANVEFRSSLTQGKAELELFEKYINQGEYLACKKLLLQGLDLCAKYEGGRTPFWYLMHGGDSQHIRSGQRNKLIQEIFIELKLTERDIMDIIDNNGDSLIPYAEFYETINFIFSYIPVTKRKAFIKEHKLSENAYSLKNTQGFNFLGEQIKKSEQALADADQSKSGKQECIQEAASTTKLNQFR